AKGGASWQGSTEGLPAAATAVSAGLRVRSRSHIPRSVPVFPFPADESRVSALKTPSAQAPAGRKATISTSPQVRPIPAPATPDTAPGTQGQVDTEGDAGAARRHTGGAGFADSSSS